MCCAIAGLAFAGGGDFGAMFEGALAGVITVLLILFF